MYALKVSLVKVLLRICAALPLGTARALGRGFGRIYWRLGGRSRRVTERNIALAYPQLTDVQQKILARNSLLATGELMAEMGRVWLRPWWELSTKLEIDGAELISDALDSGRGVLVLGPHLGNWEVLGLHVATLGPTVALYQSPRLGGLDELIRRSREQSGANLVPTGRSGLATLLQALKSNGIAGVLPDQVPAELAAGDNAPFMGVPCFTPTLASHLLQRTGALAVIGYAQRVPGGFHLHYRAAGDDLYSDDMALSLAALNREVELCLEQCPEQYQWEYKRFRVRPKQGQDLYQD